MGLDTADRPRSPEGLAGACALIFLTIALVWLTIHVSRWFLVAAIPIGTVAIFGLTLELGRPRKV